MGKSAHGVGSESTDVELSVDSDGASLPATLSIPASSPIGGLIPLHPADDPSRDQFLFRHLAALLPRQGVAVLRFDRRPTADHSDVPLATQARDALNALRALRQRPGMGSVPIGLWGFSQGAWAAPLAATMADEVAFLALVASTGVSPAQQMRYGVDQQLRRAGFSGEALVELAHLRAAYEDYLRGDAERATTQALIDSLADRPWFSLAWVPRQLPLPGAWADMDFDPAAIFARVGCPVLLFYGEDDEWTPADASIAAWRQVAGAAGAVEITVVRLPGASHHPTLQGGREIDAISPLYTQTLTAWIAAQLSR